jgi:hypothetical protein
MVARGGAELLANPTRVSTGCPPVLLARVTRSWSRSDAHSRLTWLLAAALCASACIVLVGSIVGYERTSDLGAFLRGASLLTEGRSPYTAPVDGTHHYLYAPWLAAAFIPATWVPQALFEPLWHAILAAALVWTLTRLTSSREGRLAALIIGAFGFHAVWAGHFEPLMVAMLVLTAGTRYGPVAVGVAASIKVTPIVLAVYWAGRGERGKAAMAVAVALLLWAPALLIGIDGYGIPVGYTLSVLGYSGIAWAALACAALIGGYKLAPTRYGWLAASVAWLAVMPRLLPYDVTGLLVAVTRPSPAVDRRLLAVREDKDRYTVPMELAPARVLSRSVDQGGIRRQEDRIRAVSFKE